MKEKRIWTVGHSTRSLDEFVRIVESFNIASVADVRHFPGSRKFPHFNREQLRDSLALHTITYHHLESLGGRRKPHSDSKNLAWRHPAFRGYADYMNTPEFREGLAELEELGSQTHTVYMCSEAVWWRCHRALISDVLKSKGWSVHHIFSIDKATEHPFTSAARFVDGQLSYE